MKKTITFLAAGLLLSLSSVYADTISENGSTTSYTGFSVGTMTQLASTSGVATSSNGNLSFTYTQTVVSDSSNPFCSGCLDFLYEVVNTGTDAMAQIATGSFDGWQTNVGYLSTTVGPSGVAFPGIPLPDSISRTGSPDSAVNFNYNVGAGLVHGYATPVLVIATDTHWFNQGTLTGQDGVPAFASVFAPAVPEPMSMGLLGGGLLLLGLLGLLGYRRRKAVNL